MAQTPAIDGARIGDHVLHDDWRSHAACRDFDCDLFFPNGTTGGFADDIAAAKRLCAQCPVIEPCLNFALVSNQEFGVWGGTSEDERRQLRRAWLRMRRLSSSRTSSDVARGEREAS